MSETAGPHPPPVDVPRRVVIAKLNLAGEFAFFAACVAIVGFDAWTYSQHPRPLIISGWHDASRLLSEIFIVGWMVFLGARILWVKLVYRGDYLFVENGVLHSVFGWQISLKDIRFVHDERSRLTLDLGAEGLLSRRASEFSPTLRVVVERLRALLPRPSSSIVAPIRGVDP